MNRTKAPNKLAPNTDGVADAIPAIARIVMDDIIYVVALGNGLAVGVIFFTRERAEAAAKRLKLRYYEVIPYRINSKKEKTRGNPNRRVE